MSCHSLAHSSSSDQLMPRSIPQDRCGFIWLGFAILGTTTLVSWNFFITADDYWKYKFRNIHDQTSETRTPLQTFFESYLSIAANFPMLIAMIVTSLYGQKIRQAYLLQVPLVIMLIVFLSTTIFAIKDTDKIQYFFFALTIIMVILLGFFSAVFQAALFGYTSNFPSHCMHAMVNGQSIAGLLATALQVLSLAIDSGPIVSGQSYFGAASVFLLIALVYFRSMDNEYTRYYLRSDSRSEDGTRSQLNLLGAGPQLLQTIKDVCKRALVVMLTFGATLSVFPSVCVLVVPKYPDPTSFFTGKYFVSIVTFFLFNSADLAGRLTSTYLPFPPDRPNLLLSISIGRFILPVLILFCNVIPRYHTSTLFTNDAIFPILVTLLGITNGYIFSTAMVLASKESHPERRELTGFVMATSLGIGLTLGSISSLILINLI